MSPTKGLAMSDKVDQAVIEALKQGMTDTAEQRLFRSGKLPGLFTGRTGVQAEAAAQALRDGLLEVVRTETRGKTTVEWVRVTPQGVEFLANRESPVRAMDELRAALQITQEGIPAWLAQIRRSVQELGERITKEVQSVTRRLEALNERVTEALRRAEQKSPAVPPDAANGIPWTASVVGYLDRRRDGGLTSPCPLPELFAAVRAHHGDVTLPDYHAGLRRLQDRGVLRLLPPDGAGELTEPEHALLDGAAVYYYAAR
jgi:hypothetical protein